MTLSVDVYIKGPDGEEQRLDLPSDLAGVESARRTFYGSEISRGLGLKWFPMLSGRYQLECEGNELHELRREAVLLFQYVHDNDEEEYRHYWSFRLNNIFNAIDAALHFDGVVTIG